ncbi:TolC family protein [Dyadobacter pollutisoli]|uniref:TolC family protein n=1 Tax=Dyadobacter pollutisoli TaxID=2910158 RepID=A0A9E8NG58_9BACT|nr:TolC family protein [Dyadobacter pollutisoli]WAC13479.1 TolC family protein [Dyadobacter pollutisoli]
MARLLIIFLCTGFCQLKIAASAQSWSLEKCLNYAREHNPELQVSRSKLSGAAIDHKSATARLIPKIVGNGALDHYWKIPVQVFPGQLVGQPEGTFVPVRLGTPWMGNIGLEADLNLIDVEAWKQIRLAALDQQLLESDGKSAVNQVVRNVHMAYLSAQLGALDIAGASEQYSLYEQGHRLLRLQFEKGLTDKISLNQSEIILRNLKTNIVKTQTDFACALLDLKFWMGYPMEDSIGIDQSFNEVLMTQKLENFNEERLPDHQTYLLRTEIHRRQYALARAVWYPKVSLRSGYSRLGFGQNLDFIGSSKWFSSGFVGLKVAVPILDLEKMVYEPKRQKGLIRTADLEHEQFLQQQKQIWLRGQKLMSQALRTISEQEQNLLLSSENELLSRKKLEKGIINFIELRQLQEELSLARRQLTDAKREYLKHYLTLHYLQNN